MPPKVTVITATYNSSRTLRFTLESVLMQDFADFEYLVIGDGCTDDSEEVVRLFDDPRVQWHNLSSNSGSQGIPNNHGLRLARGQLIAHVGHDDLWFPWHLSGLVAAFDSRDVDWLQAMTAMVTPDGLETIHVGVPLGFTYESSGTTPSSWLYRCCEPRFGEPHEVIVAPDFDFQTYWFRQGWRMKALEELSVIKFPSAAWKLYSQQSSCPQALVLENLRSNPRALQRSYLNQAARKHFEYRQGIHDIFFMLRSQVRRRILLWLMTKARFYWGGEALLRFIFRQLRLSGRKARGLT